MKSCKFKYEGRLTSLNEYIKANRGSKGKYFGNQTKKFWTDDIAEKLVKRMNEREAVKFDKPVWVEFHWIEPNAKRDPDNIIFAKKFVLDGMVKAGLLAGDGQKHVAGFTDTWEVDRNSTGAVIVTVREVK